MNISAAIHYNKKVSTQFPWCQLFGCASRVQLLSRCRYKYLFKNYIASIATRKKVNRVYKIERAIQLVDAIWSRALFLSPFFLLSENVCISGGCEMFRCAFVTLQFVCCLRVSKPKSKCQPSLSKQKRQKEKRTHKQSWGKFFPQQFCS